MKIKFVFVSKDNDFLMSDDDFNSVMKSDSLSVYTEFISDNKIDIPTIYNQTICSSINPNTHTCDFDYIVLSHADVKFNPVSFISHLIWIDGKYNMIGLAGTKNLNSSASPLNWFVGSNQFPYSRYGDVTMTDKNGSEVRCFYNQYKPEIKDTEVACIDGLCIILSKKLIEKGFRFDTGISDFDFYDTGASFKCLFEMKGKLGVMIEPVFHESEGLGILKPEFLEDEKKFRERWKSNLEVQVICSS